MNAALADCAIVEYCWKRMGVVTAPGAPWHRAADGSGSVSVQGCGVETNMVGVIFHCLALVCELGLS